ncbi:MAG TPA: LytR C-terminal domain-containing protein [Gemmatimonadales bacterium]|nr:LytR C-terminal domain-containing protein [Gemmatimonadales bacterium]
MELARRALSALLLAVAACREERARVIAFPVPGDDGPRITVEVLNASGKPGLARAGSRVLRRAGIDVVTFGNAPPSLGALDSTRIVMRRRLAGAGERIRKALGAGRVLVELDSTRLLDASVFLGADFAPRVDFHP